MNQQDKEEILSLLDTYVKSAIEASTELAAKVWYDSEEVSFIHPRGESQGFESVKKDFYINTMGANFSKRHLKMTNEPTIYINENTAIVQFHWEFIATLKDNGEELTSQGRESQTLIKFPKLGWRIMHIHYSQMPVTARGEGF